MIKSLFFIFCCIMPCAAEAGEILNVQDGFKIAKAVKLGRGNAYSVSSASTVNTGAGGNQIKNCPSNCADCDNSTSCNECKSGYGKARSGACVACPSQCSQCIYNANVGEMTCSGGCISGYHLEYNSTGTYSECCPTGKILSDDRLCVPETCEAGTYRSSGSNLCESCAAGTYSTGSNAASCKACSTLYVGSNKTCTACSAQGSCYSSQTISCSAGYYLSSGSNCVACAAGTYSYGETATSCSSCSDLFVGSNGGMRFTCLSCSTTGTCLTCGYNGSSSGYEMSNGKCEYVGSNSGSGSSSGSNSGSTTTRTCASEYSSKPKKCKTSQEVIYCCPNSQDCDLSGVPQGCTRL